LHEWIKDTVAFPKGEAFISAYVEALLKVNIAEQIKKPQSDGINAFSAEMTSLHLMYEKAEKLCLDPEQDTILLLLSESPEGVLAGLINARLLSHADGKYLKEQPVTPQLAIVPGLQVKNFQRFFSEGLRGFVNCIRDAVRRLQPSKPLLNITGGFKSLVTYSTYIALAFDFQIVFVFEDLTDVVVIEPPSSNLSDDQHSRLISEIRMMVARTVGLETLEPDPFDL
jgi:putative CRISPR-associated protein (TIGR02619 family)